jgi:hypothetical protein
MIAPSVQTIATDLRGDESLREYRRQLKVRKVNRRARIRRKVRKVVDR